MQFIVQLERGLICVSALWVDHLLWVVSLSAVLGWLYRADDWRFAFELGHGVAVENDRGLVATALWWPYDDGFALFGMIIVTPSLQGCGIGRRLMDELLRQVDGRAVILNFMREGYRFYEQLGFVAYGQVNQHQGVLAALSVDALANEVVCLVWTDDIAAIREVDRLASGMGRTRLLDALFAVGKIAVVEREGCVQGYACVCLFGRGVVVGFVVVWDTSDAQALVATLAADHRGSFVRIDVSAASGFSLWLEEIGLPQVDDVVSMARGKPSTRAVDATLYALSNQSLG